MTMHRGSFDIAKKIFLADIANTAEAKAAFDGLAPAAQAKALADAFKTSDTLLATDFGVIEAACFVLIYRTQTGKATPAEAVQLRAQLGVPAPTGWKKPLPFVSVMALVSQWPEEYAKIPEIAATVPHAALNGDPLVADSFIAAGVRAVLGMGGLQDSIGVDGAIGTDDPIMKIFIEAVKFQLMTVTAPAWFEGSAVRKALPEGVDARSAYEVHKATEAEKLKAKAEARRVAAAKRREEQVAAYKAMKANFFAGPIASDPVVGDVVKALKAASFEDLKTLTDAEVWLTPDLQAHATRYEVAPAPVEATQENAAAAAEAVAAAKAKAKALAINLVQQFVLNELAKVNAWFVELATGDIGLRRGIGRVSTGVDRKTRAIRSGVSRLVSKYGKEKVLEQLALFSTDFDAVFIKPEDDEADESAKSA